LVQVTRLRMLLIIDDYNPLRVIQRAARDIELRPERRGQPLDVPAYGRYERLDSRCQVLDAIGLGRAGSRIQPDIGHVGLITLRQHTQLAAVEIDPYEGSLVKSDGAEQQRGSGFLDHDGPRRQTV